MTRPLATETARTIMGQSLEQIPWLFGLHLGCFVVIVLAGLAWHTYWKPLTARDAVEPAS